jgi:RND family efflux transporter MFP subunit
MKNKKNRIAAVGGGVVVFLLVLLIAGGIVKKVKEGKAAAAKYELEQAARPVTMERVMASAVPQTRGYPGTVRASEEAALSFRVGGPLVIVNVTLGRPVKKGELLMQIDPRDFEDRIASLEAQLSGAQALLDNARQDFDRAQKLFGEKVIAQAAYDRATSSLDSADASVKTLKAQLQIARHSLLDTQLTAPYDGQVTAQLVENHEMVHAGQVVLKYHDIQWLEVTVNMPENDIVHRSLLEGTPAHVSFSSVPGKRYDAKLMEWSSLADPLTRTYAVRFRFEAPKNIKVLPGMSAEIRWAETSSETARLTVPVSALSSTADGRPFVWVYSEQMQTAEQRLVETGQLADSSRMAVLSGLKEGEQVVVSGSRLVHEGQKLTVMEK